MSYTIKLADGKYTIINDNGLLTFQRHGEAWPGADDLKYAGVVLAMAQRIEELEVAIKAVLDGTLLDEYNRNDDGMADYDPSAWNLPLQKWEDTLRDALEQRL